MTDTIFTTPARTLEELRGEVLTDLHRRLASLDLEAKFETRIRESTAIGRAKIELESMLQYWTRLQIRTKGTKA